ncbi:MAG: ABC transporter permease subunit, partial [Thermoplasmata archaeon]
GFTGTVQNAGGFRSYNELLVFYPGPNGTAPPGYQVYWAVPQNQTGLVTPLPESAMHRLGTLTQIHQTFHLVVPVPPTSTGPCTAFQCGPGNLQVELFTSDGQLVATDTNQSAGNFFPPTGLAAGTSITFGFAGIVMVILVPLMAVLAAYSVYGKDRLTGVLEGVLVRPVSRLGLVASRYLAVITALCIAVLAGVITLDALVAWVYGGFLPLAVVGVILGGLLVEVGAFTGITFLLSHVLRTTGGLVGIGLAIFAFFTIGWLVLIPLLGALTGVYFTPGFQTAIVELAFLNPTQFLILGEDLFLGSVQGIFYPGAPGVPIAYGITDGSVIGAALAWVIGPAALLFYVVRRRD